MWFKMPVQTLSFDEASKKWADVTGEIQAIKHRVDSLDTLRLKNVETNIKIRESKNQLRKQLRLLLQRSKKLQVLIESGKVKTKGGLVLIK